MAHKTFGGWFLNSLFYAQIKVANELWYFSRDSDNPEIADKESQVSLFFIGWYESSFKNNQEKTFKLYGINFLNISIQWTGPSNIFKRK